MNDTNATGEAAANMATNLPPILMAELLCELLAVLRDIRLELRDFRTARDAGSALRAEALAAVQSLQRL